MKTIALLVAITTLLTPSMNVKMHQPFEATTIEERAEMAGMETDEFILMSSVVEAESNRSQNVEDRVLIALTILNRRDDDRFPSTITGVLTQSGQFSTVRNGASVVNRTDISDQAVIEAVEWLERGDAPHVLFFNCIGYNGLGEPYDYVGGNYFSVA